MLSTNMNNSLVGIVLQKSTDFVRICLNYDLHVEALPIVPMLYSDVQRGQLHSPSDTKSKSKLLSYVLFVNHVYINKRY